MGLNHVVGDTVVAVNGTVSLLVDNNNDSHNPVALVLSPVRNKKEAVTKRLEENMDKESSCRALVPYKTLDNASTLASIVGDNESEPVIVPLPFPIALAVPYQNKPVGSRNHVVNTSSVAILNKAISECMEMVPYYNNSRTVTMGENTKETDPLTYPELHTAFGNEAMVNTTESSEIRCGDDNNSFHTETDSCYFDDAWSTTSTLTVDSWSAPLPTACSDEGDDCVTIASTLTEDLSTFLIDNEEEEIEDNVDPAPTRTENSTPPVVATINPWDKDNVVDAFFGSWWQSTKQEEKEEGGSDAILVGFALLNNTLDNYNSLWEQVVDAATEEDASSPPITTTPPQINFWDEEEEGMPSLAFLSLE